MNLLSFTKQYSGQLLYLLLGLFALGSMWLLRNSTLSGPGLINDSIAYIGGARSILAGTGYSQIWLASGLQPITHYPPLFSLTLVLIGLFDVDPFLGARMANILLLGANIILIGYLGSKIFEDRVVAAVLAFLFAINGAIFRVHSYAISEPLFLFFFLLIFVVLHIYLHYKTWNWLAGLGFLVGMAILDRYVGFVLLGVIAVVVVLFENTWRSRLSRLGIYLMSSLPLPIAWFIYNARISGTTTNRGIGWHPVTTENLLSGVANLAHWLIPLGGLQINEMIYFLPKIFLMVFIAITLLIVLAAEASRILKGSSANSRLHPILFTVGAFAWIYPISVLLSISFLDPATKLQDRILVPVYVSLLILMFESGRRLSVSNRPVSRMIAVMIGILILGLWLRDLQQTVFVMRKDGQGYASRQYQESGVMKFVEQLPQNTLIYTDSPTAIYSATERPSFVILMGEAEDDERSSLVKINEQLREGNAILVLFDAPNYTDPVSAENFHSLTEGVQMVVKFGVQKAYQGTE